MKCLVTGATGFIGSALTQRLLSEGHQVRVLLHTTQPRNIRSDVEYVYGDLTVKDSISGIVNDIDVIYHCAGIVSDVASLKRYDSINVQGTKHLVEECKQGSIKRFVFLGHIPYESTQKKYPYPQSKANAESYLLKEYEIHQFPVVIIRPGNVFGPNASTWVKRPIESICHKKIALIDNGTGIFLHTYIDNLIDALILVLHIPDIDGEIFHITDGDNTITWKIYFNDLATILQKNPVKRSLSKPVAMSIGYVMLVLKKLFGINPLVTPYAVEIFSQKNKISIKKAQKILGYHPKVNYKQAMNEINRWVYESKII